MIEEALVALLGHSSLDTLIGGRVYAVDAADSATLPAIVYSKISSKRLRSLSGSSPGLALSRLQLDVYAEEYDQAKSVSRAVIERLDGFSGTSSGIELRKMWLDAEEDLYEGDPGVYRVSMDFLVWHSLHPT